MTTQIKDTNEQHFVSPRPRMLRSHRKRWSGARLERVYTLECIDALLLIFLYLILGLIVWLYFCMVILYYLCYLPFIDIWSV